MGGRVLRVGAGQIRIFLAELQVDALKNSFMSFADP